MWKVRLKLYGALLGCPLAAYLVGHFSGDYFRPWLLLHLGVVLELAGIGRVLFEVSATAKKYGRPTILQILGLKKRVATVRSFGVAISQEASVSMKVTRGRNPQTIDDRIRFLEEDVKTLGASLEAHKEATGKDVAALRTADREAKEALEKAIVTLKEELREVASGGVESEYWWAVLFAAGLVLTNYYQWLADHLFG